MVVQPRNADALASGARPHRVPFLPSSKRFDLQTLWLGVVHNGPPSASSPSLVLLADRVFVQRYCCTGGAPLQLRRPAPGCGARPIQPFEGSRPWGGVYADSMVMGLSERLWELLVEWERATATLIGM